MLPPVLEIYVVWHPDDLSGETAAEQIIGHFHGTTFSGLIGGAIEVYVRSAGWDGPSDAPRPLPCIEPLPLEIPAAQFTAIVPVMGTGLAAAVESGNGRWHAYVAAIADARKQCPQAVAVFPLLASARALDGTELGRLLGGIQQIGVPSGLDEGDADRLCRDLAQGVAQLAAEDGTRRLTIFVSHTKRLGHDEGETVRALIDQIRQVIGQTRLQEFFDANDLQVGEDWAPELIKQASTGALLAVRTDLYSSRGWCQREMVTAKQARMPVVILDALSGGEARGSFLMDHVPRIPGRPDGTDITAGSILRALNQLVDECLKRVLWERQETLAVAEGELSVTWWAAHAPEPITFTKWLLDTIRSGSLESEATLRVLHPDPPLGPDEIESLKDIVAIAGLDCTLEVLTPRGVAARGG